VYCNSDGYQSMDNERHSIQLNRKNLFVIGGIKKFSSAQIKKKPESFTDPDLHYNIAVYSLANGLFAALWS